MAPELSDRTTGLLDAFVAAWARGESPDPREALSEAPAGERDALAHAIDRFLSASSAREPSAEAREVVAALRWQIEREPPLVAARVRRGLRRGDVVRALRERLGLTGAAEPKLEERYHELEAGLLDTSRVSQSVWDAIAAVVDEKAAALARTWRPPSSLAPTVFARDGLTERLLMDMGEMSAPAAPPPGAAAPLPPAEESDEVDRLFGT